jgi:sugar phosphate permease
MIAMRKEVKNAIAIGVLCSVSYLAVYFARNILGAVTPQMIGTGNFTTEYIGSVSSVYFIFYAVGQLINGAIGDKIKARYMISFGLLLAGITNLLFSLLPPSSQIATFTYGMTGFFLSMIYGPMTKVVAENTEPIYATRCSLGYTFASFFGSPLAGVAAAALVWQSVFAISSMALFVMAVTCFSFFFVPLKALSRISVTGTETVFPSAVRMLSVSGILIFETALTGFS